MRHWRASADAMASIKPIVNSWDVFDTLLTRFVLDPLQIFALIDRRHPGLDFFNRRLEAQRALDRIGKPYVIYEIYRQMVELGLGSEIAKTLLAEELGTEKSLMLPVRKAVEQVMPTDLLISDMYLPGEVIGAMLAEICDLHCALPVIRSNWGKNSGTLWPRILEHYVIRTHYGDNIISDGEMPRKFGINTVLLRDIDLTEWEKTAARLGGAPLALILRETRLRSLTGDAGEYETLACGPYLALLLGYCGFLAERFGADAEFGFLSRDCDDLARIFRSVFPFVRAFNIDLSRRLARNACHDEFFAQALPPDCVLVDAVSTGRSAGELLQRIGASGRVFHTLLLLDHLLDAKAVSKSAASWI
jgi:predicted HAD superfamily hydrolase